MPQQKKQRSAKAQALRQSGTFNPKAQEVQDRLFLEEEFFDAHDLAQVKYEMLRRVQKEGAQISQAASSFGFSRPSFYKAQADFLQEGLAGLIGKKRGPKGRHKLSTEIMDFVEQRRMQDPSLRVATLLELIQETFGTRVHRRTLERALVAAKKNLINHQVCAELLFPSRWTCRTLRKAPPTGLIKKSIFRLALSSGGVG